METVRINMTPNNEVKTIHCSQNDGNTRKWGFELYKEDGVIDGSSIKEQMLFNAYKGGTEQILPENTSTPTTSPIIADIQYPDAMRSDQEFLYRECPTAEDGQAKITKIKGNTLVWNQLVQNGNFASTNGWIINTNSGSFSVSNNIATVVTTAAWAGFRTTWPIIQGHKYYYRSYLKKTTASDELTLFWGSDFDSSTVATANTTEWQLIASIKTSNSTVSSNRPYIDNRTASTTFQLKQVMFFDLTSMGIDNLTTTSEVEAWLSSHIGNLPFFAYNPGSLLSFNGTGIKTIGKNLFDSSDATANSIIYYSNAQIASGYSNAKVSNYIEVKPNTNYKYFPKGNAGTAGICFFDNNKTYISGVNCNDANANNNVVTTPSNSAYVRGTFYTGNSDECYFGLASSYDSFVPYEESTLSLPVSTHFPTGMKSAGTVYDELTENKAYTRVGSDDLGSLNWFYDSSSNRMYSSELSSAKAPATNGTLANIKCSKYVSVPTLNQQSGNDKTVSLSTNKRVYVYDTSYSDATTFKQMLIDNDVKLYYELATYTETDITTASLVTEKGETPLYCDDDILKADCLTALSSEAGIFDAKIKLMDDETVYSQKIQLHVERKP